MGYNGMPIGCSDDSSHGQRAVVGYKYLYVCHAEMNAILNSGTADLRKSCLHHAVSLCGVHKALIQKGIAEVYYLSDKCGRRSVRRGTADDGCRGCAYRQYKPTGREITIRV